MVIYKAKILPQSDINKGLLMFGIMGSLFIYGFDYKKLRRFDVNIVWIIISIIQIFIYSITKNNYEFNDKIGSTYLNSLFYLPIMLFTFQILRFIFKAIFKQELIINTRRYNVGDIIENREIKWVDTIFSVIGMMMIIFGIDIVKLFLKN